MSLKKIQLDEIKVVVGGTRFNCVCTVPTPPSLPHPHRQRADLGARGDKKSGDACYEYCCSDSESHTLLIAPAHIGGPKFSCGWELYRDDEILETGYCVKMLK